jgi:hypothetical protein
MIPIGWAVLACLGSAMVGAILGVLVLGMCLAAAMSDDLAGMR